MTRLSCGRLGKLVERKTRPQAIRSLASVTIEVGQPDAGEAERSGQRQLGAPRQSGQSLRRRGAGVIMNVDVVRIC
jgi:hypothetical protein